MSEQAVHPHGSPYLRIAAIIWVIHPQKRLVLRMEKVLLLLGGSELELRPHLQKKRVTSFFCKLYKIPFTSVVNFDIIVVISGMKWKKVVNKTC